MNLSKLKDAEVLMQIKDLVGKERYLLTQVLHHLREVEYRKLFSDLGYKSLFDYAVKELKYSEGQAGRRIQAMRLLKELPVVEEKIKSGALTLTHLSQAQSYFREKAQAEKGAAILSEKMELLAKMENTSSRESEKMILALDPVSLPKEKERLISPEHTEVRFVMDDSLKQSLEEVRTLLGPKALHLSFADLVWEMAQLSTATLKAKKFGKRRVQADVNILMSAPTLKLEKQNSQLARNAPITNTEELSTPVPEGKPAIGLLPKGSGNFSTPAPELGFNLGTSRKGISRRLKFLIWQRDQGRCVTCASTVNLNIDHIHPKGLGGADTFENLRLLCFHCNQRRRIKTYGLTSVVYE